MNVNTALFFNSLSDDRIAYHMAEARMVFDPEAKKIRERIAEHEEAIRKLEVKLEKHKTKIVNDLLPKAKEAKEEAKSIVEMRRKMLNEFERKVRSEKAL